MHLNFRPLKQVSLADLPEKFSFLIDGKPHSVCFGAISDLQYYLANQNDWTHNFGLDESKSGVVIGKMFGVLIVRNPDGEIGYLAAFSGKLAEVNHLPGFVPPVYDALSIQGFLNKGMAKLRDFTNSITTLENELPADRSQEISILKHQRRSLSASLQKQLSENYFFLNQHGEQKSLNDLFKKAGYRNPPSGAGECAAPKLLQYAFLHKLKPVAIAEFWWGQSPKSDSWKHRNYYPCCEQKCAPILSHMLKGLI